MTTDESISTTVTVDGKVITTERGRTLLNVLTSAGVLVQTACGGKGTCHLCRLTVLAGRETLPVANASEKKALGNVLLAQGMRLACQVTVEEPVEVKLPVYESPEERRERIRRARERRR